MGRVSGKPRLFWPNTVFPFPGNQTVQSCSEASLTIFLAGVQFSFQPPGERIYWGIKLLKGETFSFFGKPLFPDFFSHCVKVPFRVKCVERLSLGNIL